MEASVPAPENLEGLTLGPIYRVSLLANMVGLVVIFLINISTPLEFFREQRAFFREGGWVVLALLWPLVFVLAFLVQRRFLLPVHHLKRILLTSEKPVQEGVTEKAARRIVNLPLATGLNNLGMWVVVPALVVVYFILFREASLSTCLFLFFRAFMVGLIASGLSFFLMEYHLRKGWIPRLFPTGRLSSMSGTFRIPVMRRIQILWRAGTLNPMLILLGTLLQAVGEVGGKNISAREMSLDLLVFTVLLCALFIIIAAGLNLLVQKSITGPIQHMMAVFREVGKGDFSRRIQVVSNDEIGTLGDEGNDMIAGLAERERIRETFGRYVTPEIRDRILADTIPVNGERRLATVLFSDLRDFTPYVEETTPEEVISSMRDYFTLMERVIRNRQGLVLQYVGDEVEAAFNAPIPCEKHADEAVLAALEIRRALEEFNRERAAQGKQPFRHGLGIHTGMVLAGNTGSLAHLSYALIGETVNVAARVQDLTKKHTWDILITEETAEALKGNFLLKRESPVMVKGYSRPVTVYRVLG